MRMSVEEFTDLCRQIFRQHGFNEEETDACTEEIVTAQCRGYISHGAALMPLILESKKELPGPIEIVKETPILAYMIGNSNVGPVVARRAMDIAIEKAKKNQIGVVGVNNKFPFILAGYNPSRAAKQGLIGINWLAVSPRVAPWGSADPIIGTNPIGIAIPSNDGPIVLDMATSDIPVIEVIRRKKLGLKIPEGVAISRDGTPTTDPGEALEGALLPFGGHKGSGLGIMVQLLGGVFVGGRAGSSIPGNLGMVFVAMQCDLFVPKEKFLTDVSTFIWEVRSSRVRPGFERVFLPGERGDREVLRAKHEGIEIEALTYEEFRRLADKGSESISVNLPSLAEVEGVGRRGLPQGESASQGQ